MLQGVVSMRVFLGVQKKTPLIYHRAHAHESDAQVIQPQNCATPGGGKQLLPMGVWVCVRGKAQNGWNGTAQIGYPKSHQAA